MKFTYNKRETLKSQKAISQLFVEGKGVMAHPLRLVYLKNDTQTKVAVSVSKRNFKKAVHRIRIKRLLREAYRLNKYVLIDNNIDPHSLMILYIGKDMPDFTTVEAKTKTLLTKFINKTSNSSKS